MGSEEEEITVRHVVFAIVPFVLGLFITTAMRMWLPDMVGRIVYDRLFPDTKYSQLFRFYMFVTLVVSLIQLFVYNNIFKKNKKINK